MSQTAGYCTRSKSSESSNMTSPGDNKEEPYTLDHVMKELLEIKDVAKSTNSKLDELRRDHDMLEEKVDRMDGRLNKVEGSSGDMMLKAQLFQNAIQNAEISSLANELNSNRNNVIIDDVAKQNVIEKPEESEKLVRDFLTNTLKMQNADNILISDAHRLAVSSSYEGTRPPALIFKVVRLMDKRLIANHLSNLKDVNATLPKGKKFFVNLTHLPKQLESDKKSLKDKFDAARKAKKKPSFKFDRKTGLYCLHVGNVVYKPIRNTVMPPSVPPESPWNQSTDPTAIANQFM